MKARRQGRRTSPAHWIARAVGWLFTAAVLVIALVIGAMVVLAMLQQPTP